MVPASMGVPGGMELAVMAVILLLLAGVVFAVVVAGRSVLGASGGESDRVTDLESRVADLEAELGAVEAELADLRRERDSDDT